MSDWLGIVYLVILLLLNAFFVGAEFAVVSARRSKIEPLAEEGRRSAQVALSAMENATTMLAVCQLGITVCSLLILNVSEPAIHHLLEVPLQVTGWPAEVVATIAFIVALVVVSYLHVVIGELVPKNISFSLPERAILLLAPPLVLLARVLRPVIQVLNWISNGVLRLFRVTPKSEINSAFTFDEVASIVEHSKREGVLDDTSGTVSAAFEFTGKKVVDVAVPIGDIVTLPAEPTASQVQEAVATHGHSRFLVAGEGEEDLSGYLHLKDILDLEIGEEDAVVPAKRIRRLLSVYDRTDIEDALASMRRSGVHLARVFDEHGSTSGVLFLEDIIEELIGQVQG